MTSVITSKSKRYTDKWISRMSWSASKTRCSRFPLSLAVQRSGRTLKREHSYFFLIASTSIAIATSSPSRKRGMMYISGVMNIQSFPERPSKVQRNRETSQHCEGSSNFRNTASQVDNIRLVEQILDFHVTSSDTQPRSV
jgi:hypothetical protein